MMDEYLAHRPSPGKYCQVPDPTVRMKRRIGTRASDARRAGGELEIGILILDLDSGLQLTSEAVESIPGPHGYTALSGRRRHE
eukprot:SAG31_NODE_20497_length_572_cov_11.551797_2_plen_83_part_00